MYLFLWSQTVSALFFQRDTTLVIRKDSNNAYVPAIENAHFCKTHHSRAPEQAPPALGLAYNVINRQSTQPLCFVMEYIDERREQHGTARLESH